MCGQNRKRLVSFKESGKERRGPEKPGNWCKVSLELDALARGWVREWWLSWETNLPNAELRSFFNSITIFLFTRSRQSPSA